MKKFLLSLIFYSLFCQGNASPCDEVGNDFECIQFLQRSILDIQNQIGLHSGQLDIHSHQLQSQTAQLEDHSERLNNLPHLPDLSGLIVRVDKNSAEIESHAAEISILAEVSTAQGAQLVDFSSELSSQSTQLTDLSNRITNHTVQLENHSDRLNDLTDLPDLSGLIVRVENISTEVEKQNFQLDSHTAKLSALDAISTTHSAQLTNQSSQLSSHATQLSNQSTQFNDLSNQLTDQAAQLDGQADQLENLSDRLNDLPDLPDLSGLVARVETNAAEIDSHSVKLNILTVNSTAQGNQLTDFSSDLKVLHGDVEDHSVQLTNHSSQLSSQSTQLTSQSSQLSSQSTQLTSHTSQLSSQSSQLSSQATQLSTHSSLIQGLQNNTSTAIVPIGFIYVQLPQQSAPTVLWPTYGWQEVTASYAGLFFRASGGSAGSFETIQEGDSPRITEIGMMVSTNTDVVFGINLAANNQFSAALTSGGSPHPDGTYKLRFKQSNAEVRPRNTAVRIWKRST